MPDRRDHQAALVGQVVEDLSFEPLDPDRLQADVAGGRRRAEVKAGGFFVFSDLAPGAYRLRLAGERLEPQEIPVTLPFAPLRLARPGDNELVIAVEAVDAAERRITFEPALLPRPIPAGAPVLAAGVETRLAKELPAGPAVAARLESAGGLAPGALVRIVRERSIRLRPDPYATLPGGLTRLVGRVARAVTGQPVAGAEVRLLRLGDAEVEVRDVAGAPIAVVAAGRLRLLGTERDVACRTNARGDYHLYFPDGLFPAAVTLAASAVGLAPASRTVEVSRGERQAVDFRMERT